MIRAPLDPSDLDPPLLLGLATAGGIGLMLGLLRERHEVDAGHVEAGIRTHAIAALVCAASTGLATPLQAVVLACIAALVVASHRVSARHDAGLTGEATLLASAVLGMLAMAHASLAAGIGVVVALLVHFKPTLHGLARERVSEPELRDGLTLLAAALVVLPLLPTAPVDPWGVIVPSRLWRIVVLVMGVGMVGHVATRTLGQRWGLPVSGFFSGFASSTAAVAAFGQRSRDRTADAGACASAALLANLASVVLLGAVVAAVAPALLAQVLPALLAAALALALAAALGLRRTTDADEALPAASTSAFRCATRSRWPP